MLDALQTHWGFTVTPFTASVPVAGLFGSAAHKEAVARLRWLISARGLGVLTGEVGSGKTAALRAAADGLDASRHALTYLPNPQIGVRGLHGAVPRRASPGGAFPTPASAIFSVAVMDILSDAGHPGTYDKVLTSQIAGTGVPPVEIFIQATTRKIGEFLLFIVVGAQFYCGMSSVTANSRMIYAFSRDGAIPGSAFWHKINKRTRTPTNSIWLAAAAAFILGVPYLWSPVAYAAVTSIAVIGLYVAYAIPVYLRLRAGESFQRGPWHLGRWSYIIGWTTVVWVVFITILFTLPQVSPISITTFNYASITTAVVLFGAGGWYLASAKNWFHGPKVQGTPEELAAIEAELTAVGKA